MSQIRDTGRLWRAMEGSNIKASQQKEGLILSQVRSSDRSKVQISVIRVPVVTVTARRIVIYLMKVNHTPKANDQIEYRKTF